MSLEENYPILFQFFAGYFPDADFDNMTDEDVVKSYIADYLPGEEGRAHLAKVKEEITRLIAEAPNYREAISADANRYFESNDDCVAWLELIQKALVF